MEIDQLEEIATRAMIDRDFLATFSPAVQAEEAKITSAPVPNSPYKDMRDFLWVSIDNDDSRDLDQLTHAIEKDGVIKIFIAVADVDGLVKIDSEIDRHAAHNTTSVYTPTKVFPMLPLKLSNNLTSLNEDAERSAVIVEIDVFSDNHFEPAGIYLALVKNHARLTYKWVAALLDDDTPLPNPQGKVDGITEQLKLQDRAAKQIRQMREDQGNLTFNTRELTARVVPGVGITLEEHRQLSSSRLIENFMIAANITMSRYFRQNKLPILSRVVLQPKRWDRIMALAKTLGTVLPSEPDPKALQMFLEKRRKADPEKFPELSLTLIKLIGRGEYMVEIEGSVGHFDLALRQYAHTTAPNRRYPDVIVQRILKSHLTASKQPYTLEELKDLAAYCTQKEDDATKVERRVQKSAAALVLAHRIGEEFEGIITGASEKGTWVRLFQPPVEGKIVKGMQGLDIGDRVTVRLVDVNVTEGFIDFATVRNTKADR
ncbi:MAG: RNB domain-containing ribonuclease [Chlamydiales bacterium]|nr:RNB domain-containing ribonuclease [Chlamydiales bacterium]